MRQRSWLYDRVDKAIILAMFSTARAAFGAPPPPVDVVIPETAPRRIFAVEWNPLPLVTIGKLSANLVIVPVDHHALVLSPFYAWTTTAPIFVFDDNGNPSQLPEQRFTGYGGELGYRYYSRQGGPRGLFVGPSFILGSFVATAANGTKTSFLDYGAAADIGYETLVADRVALSLGAGVQYTATSKSIPSQQFPAQLYANSLVRPRLLFALGWAF
jgi:hypothetical protein